MIRRAIREWQCIEYGDDDKTIPQAEAERIATVAARSTLAGRGGEGVLERRHRSLRARGVVGVISARDCQLEILPKIEGPRERNEVTDGDLRRRLVHMLGVVHELRIDVGSLARLGGQEDTVLELLIRVFCGRLLKAVRVGLPRRYLQHADDLPALRGRLDVVRQFSRHAVAPQKVACQYDELTPDIALNQVMRSTVTRLRRIARAIESQRMLSELGLAYADVTEVPVRALRWDQVTLDRTNWRWSELVSLARLFLADRHQDTSAGAINGHALLFEMNALFEQYVARLAALALAGSGYRVVAQGGRRNCLFEESEGLFQTRPDIIIWRQDSQPALVVDTKWKRLVPRGEDEKQGVSQADVYQLMAYSQLYQCPVMLLYPHHGDLPRDPIRTRYTIANKDAKESLIVATLDLVTGRSHVHVEALRSLILGGIQ